MRKSFLLAIILILGIATQLFSQTTIFQPSDTPANPSSNDNSGSISTGVKFRSSQAGYITGIRYYKGSGTTGTRSGHLFTSGGTLLASVTFSGETSSGWQQMAFSSPIAISATTTYIASCYSSSGDYAFDPSYFDGAAVTNGPLTALQEGTDGSNGLYDYSISASTAPGSSYGSANYWVDVVFEIAPTVSSVTPTSSATGVSISSTVTATFSKSINSSTVTTSTFQLKDPSNNIISASVSTSSNQITLTPSSSLSYFTTYTATITGGSSGVKDAAGIALVSNYSWSFTTTSAPPWVLAGNTGTNPPTDFLGTTDSTDLVFKANNLERMKIAPDAPITIPYNQSAGPQLKISHAGYGTGGIEINSNNPDLTTWLDAGSAIVRNGSSGIYMYGTGEIRHSANDIYFTGYFGLENLRSSLYGGVIINNNSDSGIGLRVKGFSDPDLLITDANSNYVGIGTSDNPNPTDSNLKLAVNGNIYAKKLKVLQTGWSDYVFYPQYKLPTLKEVEEFIQKNKHLPDVPSAAEVESKGLDVGDNQAILLKKIEELTLYMIELNKKVDKLSEENEILKRKLEIRKR